MAKYEPRDRYYEQAHQAGYRSRAVFKLRDLLKRAGGLRAGSAVVELGCWPGGWLQVLAQNAGPSGLVVGVDQKPTEPIAGTTVLALDFTEPEAVDAIRDALQGRPADALLSDAAPALSGIKDVDRAAEEELYLGAFRVAEAVLKPGGFMVVKGFPGPEADAFRRQLRATFQRLSEVRPEGRRQTSREFYWLALGSKAK